VITASEIVARAESGWPYDSVPYSQSQIWNDDDGSGPHVGGYRMDCSGFASMAAALSTAGGGLNTVTFVTTGAIKLIAWADLDAGDFVGACGPDTYGDNGHIMVVVGVDHAAGTYEVLEQAGYGAGPDRNTYRIGDGQGRDYLPYRLSTLEEDMALRDDPDGAQLIYRVEALDQMREATIGGPISGESVPMVTFLKDLAAKVDALSTGGIDVNALAAALVPALLASPDFIKALTDAAFQGAQRAEGE